MQELRYPTNDKKIIDQEPCFFNVDNFSWAKPLQAEWMTIKEELDNYINLQGTAEFSSAYPTLVEGSWTSLALTFWKLKYVYYNLFPKTIAIFDKIPNCLSISFSRLSAGSVIKPHFGENNGYYRCHLGIQIPAKLPDTGFKVGDEERSWEPGGLLIFNDAKTHSAFNFSEQERTIVIFDVWREEYLHCYKEAVCHQLAIYSLFFELKIEMHCNPFNQNNVFWYNAKEKLNPKNFARYNELFDYYAKSFNDSYFPDETSNFFLGLWNKAGGV